MQTFVLTLLTVCISFAFISIGLFFLASGIKRWKEKITDKEARDVRKRNSELINLNDELKRQNIVLRDQNEILKKQLDIKKEE